MDLSEIKGKVREALELLYEKDSFLFEQELGERCIVHRLAVYLEKQKFKGYYVDCEYDKSHLNGITSRKQITSEHWNSVDIVITKRNGNSLGDLACFEIKKQNSVHSEIEKDREKLNILTGGARFSYAYGLLIILGTTKDETRIELYQKGEKIEDLNLSCITERK